MAETVTIRPCRDGDLEAMREICIETSSLPLRNEKDREFLLLMYCDSYFETEKENCFVAVSSGKVLGYILSAPDTKRFFRRFKKEIFPRIKNLGLSYCLNGGAVCFQQVVCSVFAPSHLHIDLTASARRKGVGSDLVRNLESHLAGLGVTKLQLTCGSKNKAAVAFYKRNGFKTVIKAFGACVMAKNIT